LREKEEEEGCIGAGNTQSIPSMRPSFLEPSLMRTVVQTHA